MYSERKKSCTIHCLKACTLSEKEVIALETSQLKELQVFAAQLQWIYWKCWNTEDTDIWEVLYPSLN